MGCFEERIDCVIWRSFSFLLPSVCMCVSIVEQSIQIFVSLNYWASNGRVFEGCLVYETVYSGCSK